VRLYSTLVSRLFYVTLITPQFEICRNTDEKRSWDGTSVRVALYRTKRKLVLPNRKTKLGDDDGVYERQNKQRRNPNSQIVV